MQEKQNTTFYSHKWFIVSSFVQLLDSRINQIENKKIITDTKETQETQSWRLLKYLPQANSTPLPFFAYTQWDWQCLPQQVSWLGFQSVQFPSHVIIGSFLPSCCSSWSSFREQLPRLTSPEMWVCVCVDRIRDRWGTEELGEMNLLIVLRAVSRLYW